MTLRKDLEFVLGDQVDMETALVAKEIDQQLDDWKDDATTFRDNSEADLRTTYLFNTTLAELEECDYVLLVGTNPRHEAPLVNARIRKRMLARGGLDVHNIGAAVDLTYPVDQLGNSTKTLQQLAEGRHPACKVLQKAQRPVVIFGAGVLQRIDQKALKSMIFSLAENTNLMRDDWCGFNVLHTGASHVGSLDLGFPLYRSHEVIANTQTNKVRYFLGRDDESTSERGSIYQGHHGDITANDAAVIFPASAYTEKSATFTNTEGRVQETNLALNAPGAAREDWRILSGILRTLPDRESLPVYDSILQVRSKIEKLAPATQITSQ